MEMTPLLLWRLDDLYGGPAAIEAVAHGNWVAGAFRGYNTTWKRRRGEEEEEQEGDKEKRQKRKRDRAYKSTSRIPHHRSSYRPGNRYDGMCRSA